ncbi:hypothetical protein JMUB6875_67050 [Nocardia sp. JMUB6875]|uniref:hypothetical protein n=1 Tax=Nocardia sp. JMUB6875 TaxID=3158170 RepID=UPI0032E75A25
MATVTVETPLLARKREKPDDVDRPGNPVHAIRRFYPPPGEFGCRARDWHGMPRAGVAGLRRPTWIKNRATVWDRD